MKVLVAIANHGTKNMGYLNTLLREYRGMSYKVDITVLSNIPKDFGSDVEVIVECPTKNPWSLPFGHKKLFVERVEDYDLFIYSEDDTLIKENNIKAFLKVTEVLPEDKIAGFLRYEVDAAGQRYYSTVHSHFHWTPKSVETFGEYVFVYFTNEHSACYMLTREQLKKAIFSNGFLVDPHEEKYDLLVTAATDPYTQCGFKKVICISHFKDFILHHLPNQYLGKMGLENSEVERQIEALLSMKSNGRSQDHLFQTETKLKQAKWSKSYYEECRYDILALVPKQARNVLSVGCGWGVTEAKLVEIGIQVVGIPLDMIIAACAEAKGVKIVPPNFEKAMEILADQKFDCIFFSEVLQHLKYPTDIIKKFKKLLTKNGIVIVSAPNFNHIKIWKDLFSGKISFKEKQGFSKSHLHFTTRDMLRKWFEECGIKPIEIRYMYEDRYQKAANLSLGMLKGLFTSHLIFVGEKG